MFDLFYFSLLLLAVFKQADFQKDGPSPGGCKQMEYKQFSLPSQRSAVDTRIFQV